MAKPEHDGECPAPVYLQQSPIDLGASYYHPFDVGQMSFAYPISRVKGLVEGAGEHAKVNVTDNVQIPLFGMHLKLKQLHFHSPGEHLLHGVKWPLELHIVHDILGGQNSMDAESQLLVIGVFFYGSSEGSPHTMLPMFGKRLLSVQSREGAKGDSNELEVEFNPNHCLPPLTQRGRFFRYQGSLTSGKHEEIVSWLVFEQGVPVVDADIEEILNAADQKPWPQQKLNRRVVLRSFP